PCSPRERASLRFPREGPSGRRSRGGLPQVFEQDTAAPQGTLQSSVLVQALILNSAGALKILPQDGRGLSKLLREKDANKGGRRCPLSSSPTGDGPPRPRKTPSPPSGARWSLASTVWSWTFTRARTGTSSSATTSASRGRPTAKASSQTTPWTSSRDSTPAHGLARPTPGRSFPLWRSSFTRSKPSAGEA